MEHEGFSVGERVPHRAAVVAEGHSSRYLETAALSSLGEPWLWCHSVLGLVTDTPPWGGMHVGRKEMRISLPSAWFCCEPRVRLLSGYARLELRCRVTH